MTKWPKKDFLKKKLNSDIIRENTSEEVPSFWHTNHIFKSLRFTDYTIQVAIQVKRGRSTGIKNDLNSKNAAIFWEQKFWQRKLWSGPVATMSDSLRKKQVDWSKC